MKSQKGGVTMRKALLLVVMLFVVCSFCYAGELVSSEAGKYFNAGVKAQKGGNLVEAEINYQKTVLLDPNNLDWQKHILNNRGIMFMQMGDVEKAEAAFRAAMQIDPGYKPAKLNLGLLIDKQRSRCESLEYWFKVFKMEKMIPKKFVMSDEQAEPEAEAK
jgi:tetratricopeptide (TPR) repeat protein